MTSPARAVQNNNEAVRRVQHLSDAAVLLWPDAPQLAQYYLFRMQQAAERDNLKIPHRTASKICQSCGGLITSKLRLLSAKRRTRRSAQLAARETRSQLTMLPHLTASESAPSPRPRNVLEQHCARCEHRRLFLAFQHAPVTVTPVKHAPVTEAPVTHTVATNNTINSTKQPKHVPINSSPINSSSPSSAPLRPQKGSAHHGHGAKNSMKSQVAKMLHDTKNSAKNKKKNVQDGLKQFLNSINM